MAARPQLRRKQTSWPGFFTTALVQDLPGVELDEDAEVYQQVKHLQHLRAIHDAMEETGVRDTHADYNSHLTELFGVSTINPGRFTDAFGNELGIGQTLGVLLDEYSSENVPGEHNEAGDPRGSSRTGMASDEEEQDSDERASVAADFLRWEMSSFGAAVNSLLELWFLESATESLMYEASSYMTSAPNDEGLPLSLAEAWGQVFDILQARRHDIQDMIEVRKGTIREQWGGGLIPDNPYRRRKRSEKPAPEGSGSPPQPTTRDLGRIRKVFGELLRWGNPATDFKLGHRARNRVDADALAKLEEIVQTGAYGPAIYGRLGARSGRRLGRLTAQEQRRLKEQFTLNHPFINWGHRGPPTPPGPQGGRGRPSHRTPGPGNDE